jgi:hypothetical protein
MEPTQIIQYVPELLKGGTDLLKGGAEFAGAWKLTDIVKAFLGPATAEFAERMHDSVRLYRFGRQLNALKKAEKMATEAGYTPKAVPIKLLFPLLEGASLEENEDLHTMWAALLANAGSPEKSGKVRPGFISILRSMAPDEAKLLKSIASLSCDYDTTLSRMQASSKQTLDRMIAAQNTILLERLRVEFKREDEDESARELRLETCVQLLMNPGLIKLGQEIPLLSSLGKTFLECCEPPKATT